ncbi:MAG: terminase small subunit [Rhodospirillaceae bacterium]|nr:terminase small subunit [Rhodospirillaceae bacterium]
MKELSPQQLMFVQHVVAGDNAAAAARKAGYAPHYAARAHDRLIHGNKKIAAAIDEAREKLRQNTTYTAERMLELIAIDIEFAREKGNAMAIIKGRELSSKIAGLLVDRVQIEAVSIVKALESARARAFQHRSAPSVIDVPAEAREALPARPRQQNPFED